MEREPAIGIDLGTTFSAVAWVDDSGHTAMIRNAEGDLLTPSVVQFGDKEVVVGKQARGAAIAQPDLVAQWVKRDMGAPVYSRPIHGQRLPPEVIQACILRKLRGDIERMLGPGRRVVITVPAYFDELRRKATADAGEMAGLKVLDIVNEPTAAALAFGETLGLLSRGATTREPMTLLVYDLGGGTFDLTLLRLLPGHVQTLATDGDVQLGGYDWDLRLLDHAAEAFQQQFDVDPREDPAALNRLMAAVIETKQTLSVRNRATVCLEHAGRTAELPVTREQFEELTADLLERTAYTSRQLLAAAKLEWKDVDRILLVGGATRMPMVARMLVELSGIEPDHSVNPDEAVARGAALYAAYLLGKQSDDDRRAAFEVTNVNAHSMGVEGIDPRTLRKTNVILIPRNSPLPAKVTERFTTKSDNQRSIVVKVLEGESSVPEQCTAIGRTVVRDLPTGLPKGWPVEVTFQYEANGRLSVHTQVPGTEHEARLDLERDAGLTDEGLVRWKTPVQDAAGLDVFEAMVQEVLTSQGWETADYERPGAKPLNKPAQSDSAAAAEAGRTMPLEEPFEDEAAAREPQATAAAAPAAARQSAPAAAKPASLSPLVNIAGHIVAALLGLGIGYLVLSWLRPETFPGPW